MSASVVVPSSYAGDTRGRARWTSITTIAVMSQKPLASAPPKTDDNVLYILDSQPGQQAATRNYNLQVRR